MQLCDGASPEERKQWMLKPAPEFHYLNQSSCYKLDRVDNVQEFKVCRPCTLEIKRHLVDSKSPPKRTP